jgi:hypothetical protein
MYPSGFRPRVFAMWPGCLVGRAEQDIYSLLAIFSKVDPSFVPRNRPPWRGLCAHLQASAQPTSHLQCTGSIRTNKDLFFEPQGGQYEQDAESDTGYGLDKELRPCTNVCRCWTSLHALKRHCCQHDHALILHQRSHTRRVSTFHETRTHDVGKQRYIIDSSPPEAPHSQRPSSAVEYGQGPCQSKPLSRLHLS